MVSETEGGAINNVEFENGSFSRKNADGTRWGVKLRDAVESRLWPTPTATERSGLNPNTGKGEGLSKVVKEWPTPRAANPGSRPNGQGGKILEEEVQIAEGFRERGRLLWPTPTIQVRDTEQPANAVLSPDWVEWLMGVPEGWVRLDPIDPSAYSTWFEDMSAGRWWLTERDIPRVVVGMKKRIDRLKALGNGIVPAALARFLTYDD